MARIFTDGAEFGDMLFWSDPASWSASTTQKRSGAYSYYHSSGTTVIKNTADYTEVYLRFAFYAVDPVSTDNIVSFRHSTTVLDALSADALRKLTAKVGASVVATGTNTVSDDAWHLIEIYLKIANAPDGRFTVYMDGIKEIEFSGDTQPGADTHFDNIGFYRFASGGTYIDDLALNDTTGGADNSYCGDGHIEILTPMTGGTYQWTGSDGDSVDNYALVDDIPPNSDTDYVKDSTAGHQDIYTLSDFSATGKVPLRVWAEVRAKDNDSSSGQIKLGFKTVGGTTHLSDAARTLSGAYTRVVGDEETVTPDDAGAWEDADLDGLQLVIECE